MRFLSHCIRPGAITAALLIAGMSYAQDASSNNGQQSTNPIAAGEESSGNSGGNAGKPASPPQPEHVAILKEAKKMEPPGGGEGLIPVWQKGNNLYAELNGQHYSSEYIVLISIARGIGQRPLLGGYTWNFGDDWVWKFNKVDDRVHIVRRNVRFKASGGGPEGMAVQNAYTDSVLFSLPIMSKGPGGGDLVDLTQVFMSDLPQIGQVLPGFSFAANKSAWAAVKPFRDNLELQVAATYASGGLFQFDSVADSRGITINVHYSISKVPQNGYQPRLADDRIGYFLTVVKDYSKHDSNDQFIRYINRWRLEKPPGAGDGPTPPKQPIVFWIEKTVPHKYRQPIRDGIQEWNKAFEKAGWLNAIEVRQQPDDATWDPEDINYNTFRWITSSAGFAMGPSRVNPYTGEILDADIIFDADFLQYWKQEFETLTPQTVASLTGGWPQKELHAHPPAVPGTVDMRDEHRNCMHANGMARQFAYGAAAMVTQGSAEEREKMLEKMIMQGIKETTMHEIGHTLGLRHNFRASTMLGLDDLNNPEKATNGMVASVMDYSPTNLVPKGKEQGDFYTTTIGPYDYWAVEYGYKDIPGATEAEVAELKKIASRSGQPELAFATDENVYDIDPLVNVWDLGKDTLEFAKRQAKVVEEATPGLVDRIIEEGEDYSQARRAFGVLLSQYGQSMFIASRYVGGLYTSRAHKGDENGKPPYSVVEPEKQREALKMLEESVFNDKPFQFPHEMYNYLATSNWNHWGVNRSSRSDYPVHQVISLWQERILDQLLVNSTLERIHDAELKLAPDQDAFTTAELIQRLTKAIFSELENMPEGEYSTRKPAISSLRRNLQRSYLQRLSEMALGQAYAPEDCQTIAYLELNELKSRIDKLTEANKSLDPYSKAHLVESSARIQKVLDARLTFTRP